MAAGLCSCGAAVCALHSKLPSPLRIHARDLLASLSTGIPPPCQPQHDVHGCGQHHPGPEQRVEMGESSRGLCQCSAGTTCASDGARRAARRSFGNVPLSSCLLPLEFAFPLLHAPAREPARVGATGAPFPLGTWHCLERVDATATTHSAHSQLRMYIDCIELCHCSCRDIFTSLATTIRGAAGLGVVPVRCRGGICRAGQLQGSCTQRWRQPWTSSGGGCVTVGRCMERRQQQDCSALHVCGTATWQVAFLREVLNLATHTTNRKPARLHFVCLPLNGCFPPPPAGEVSVNFFSSYILHLTSYILHLTSYILHLTP